MELSRHILKEFADVSRGVEREDKTQYLRGTIKGSGEAKYVRIDGSESLTPISEIVDVKDGDRVLVTIENHEATILGNLTMPPSAYKEQEAIDKAENAQGTAGEAVEKAENAESLAQSAGNKADAALVDATNASAAANQAKQDASEAITTAGNASKNSTEAKQLATAAGQNAETARQEAALAQNAATAAQGEVTRIQGVVTDVQVDIDTALQEVANQAADLQATKETLEVTYAKKTEVSDVQAALTTEISKKVGELQTTVSQTYAAKNDVVAMEGRLQSQITQTSGEISSVVGKVEQLESDTTEAQQKVDEALEKSAAAQVAASQAQANATASQAAADAAKANANTATQKANEAAKNAATAAATAAEADRKVSAAKTDLEEAKVNLANTMNRVGATEQEIAAAQQKVDAAQAAVTQAQIDAAEATAAANNAQNAANKAQTDATEAQNAATNAQKKADNAAIAAGNAQAAADKAQQDVSALTKRVVSAETAITQNSEQIQLAATKTEEIGDKIDNLQVGGRNLARNTYGDYTQKETESITHDINNLILERRIPTDSLSVGDMVLYKCILRYTDVVVEDTKYTVDKVALYFQGSGNITGWAPTGVFDNRPVAEKTFNIVGSGEIEVKGRFTVTEDMLKNQYWDVRIRINYGRSGKIERKCFKVEKGNMHTDWSPAPEDQQSQIDGINNNLSNNYYSKTQTDAAIKVASDNVTTTVRRETTEQITNINIGGENLIRNTNTDKMNITWSMQTGGYERTYYKDNGVIVSKLKRDNVQQTGWSVICVNGIILDKLKPNTKYIVSFEIQPTASISLQFSLRRGNGLDVASNTYSMNYSVPPNQWSKITFMLTTTNPLPNLLDQVIYITGMNSAPGAEYHFRNFKMAEGNKETPWSPAIEDMATTEQAQNAQNAANSAKSAADDANSRVSVAESTIKQLSDSISMMVTDSNGSSMMTQTSNGWTFNIGAITSAIDSAANNIDNLSGSLSQTNNVVNNLNNLANDLSKKTAYINMTTDETGAPCIELGKTGNAFKVRITNTSVDFIQGSSKIAYVSNQALFIEKAIIKSELQIGEKQGFIWKTRSNGNMGLRWFGSV